MYQGVRSCRMVSQGDAINPIMSDPFRAPTCHITREGRTVFSESPTRGFDLFHSVGLMTKKQRELLIAAWIAVNGVTRLPYMGKHEDHERWEKAEAARDFDRWLRQCRRLPGAA